MFEHSDDTVDGTSGPGKYVAENRWRVVDGKDVPPPLQDKFLNEWCMVWPRPCSIAEWARQNGVSERTMYNWRSDPRFKRVWRERADDSFAGPEYVTPLIQAAYTIALNESADATVREQLQAMSEFRSWIGHVTPKTVRHELVPADAQLAAMSDAELAEAAGIIIDVDSTEIGVDDDAADTED